MYNNNNNKIKDNSLDYNNNNNNDFVIAVVIIVIFLLAFSLFSPLLYLRWGSKVFSLLVLIIKIIQYVSTTLIWR